MAYADFKDINRRTIADEVLSDQASDIVNNAKCDGYQRGVALMAYNLKKKKTSGELHRIMQRIIQINY